MESSLNFPTSFFQLGNEVRLGIKSPRFGNLDIEEGLVIGHNDATSVPLFIDAKHLNYEPFFVLAEFFGVSIATAVAATATVGLGLSSRCLIVHLKIKQTK